MKTTVTIAAILAVALLASCSLVESVSRTTKNVLGIRDPAPPRSYSAFPENEWEATWKGERDELLKELRFGRGAAE